MKFKLIIVICLMCLCLASLAQNDSLISNNNITLNAMRISSKFVGPNTIEPSKILIYIKVSIADSNRIMKLTYNDWIKFLLDANTDWAANLYLYSIYKKDAELFSLWNTREKWIGFTQKSDIAYWKKNLHDLLKVPLSKPLLITTAQ